VSPAGGSAPVELAELDAAVEAKLAALEAWLRAAVRVVVAYSGGVDSAFLLRVARDAVGAEARAFTARSPSMMQVELEAAVALAAALEVPHEVVDTDELARPGYVENSPERCYHCKAELFDATAIAAARFGDAVVVDGFNADDLRDHRPGHRAAGERGVLHPLAEVGLRKAEIRALSRRLGLPTWDKPQLACLASRIPYGTEVTPERLGRVEQVELALRAAGFFDVRARLVAGDDAVVRIEVWVDELPRLVAPGVRDGIVESARAAGFRFVTVDLEGFRSGRMNEGLDLVQLRRPSGRMPA
jgi:uncharacterized protein